MIRERKTSAFLQATRLFLGVGITGIFALYTHHEAKASVRENVMVDKGRESLLKAGYEKVSINERIRRGSICGDTVMGRNYLAYKNGLPPDTIKTCFRNGHAEILPHGALIPPEIR